MTALDDFVARAREVGLAEVPELPSWLPRRRWQQAPQGYRPVEYGSVFPPVHKLPDGRLVVDQCRRPDGGCDVVIFDNRDHPNLARLPEHCPRVVRQLYRREFQLRLLRMVEAWDACRVQHAAIEAWEAYHAHGR